MNNNKINNNENCVAAHYDDETLRYIATADDTPTQIRADAANELVRREFA